MTRCPARASIITLTFALVAAVACGAAEDEPAARPAVAQPSAEQTRELLRVGRGVAAIQEALRNPEAPGSLDAVRTLGLDSRYYTMVRGWLAQELRGLESIRSARGAEADARLEARIRFVEQAVRAIDLE